MSAIPFPAPILWLPAAEIDPDAPSVLEAVLYAPGLLCEQCQQQLANGFVFRTAAGRLLAGQTCLMTAFTESASPWLTTLDRAQRYGPLWPVDESRIRRPWRTLAQGLGLLLQVEPDHQFALGLFQLLESGADLSAGQAAMLGKMVRERGGLAAMKRRRDLIHRLDSLKALPLSNADFEWVLDVLRWARRWRGGQMISLSTAQEHKIIYLEEKHRQERLEQVRILLTAYDFEQLFTARPLNH